MEREKILEIHKEYNLKHGMSLGQAQAEQMVSRRIMRDEGPPKQKGVARAVVRFVLCTIIFLIRVAGLWHVKTFNIISRICNTESKN